MTPMRHRLALVGSLVAVLAATATPVQAAASATTLRAITWNVCGAMCADGDAQPLATQAARAVRAWNADILFLQELCVNQMAAIRSALPGYEGTFKSQVRSGRCGGSGKHGIAVFVRGSSSNERWTNLGGTEGLTGPEYFLLAVDGRTAGGRTYTAATAHLRVKCDAEYDHDDCAPVTNQARTEQSEVIVDELEWLTRKGVPVVLGGDFNMLPDGGPMRIFYGPSAGGHGVFAEADGAEAGAVDGRGGESTVCSKEQKLDYVFYSAAQFKHLDGDAAACAASNRVSDHRLLRATATLR
jgi:endonuclease/exonuclease/phosphatase family metal-dependent hydrolase